MRLSRTRHFKVSMGNYESYDFGCTVTLEHGDLGYTDEEAREVGLAELAEEMTEQVMTMLNAQLAEEIEEASELTANEKSFLLASFTDNTRTAKKKRNR